MAIGIVVAIFIVGYIAIVFEHTLKLDKTVPALLMGALAWATISVAGLELIGDGHGLSDLHSVLLHHIGKIAEILFFLIGAMTIIELIDLHRGFSIITRLIETTNKIKMLFLICILTFFLSAILDNLTCTIVMVSLLRKLVPQKDERIWFVSFVIIAANAGGAWSPIGDVTTTMLWIGNKISTVTLIKTLILPSLVSLFLPLLIATRLKVFQGNIAASSSNSEQDSSKQPLLSSKIMLFLGIAGLIFVPIFKTLTHLPPYMGIMLALSAVWLASEFVHPEENFDKERKHLYSVQKALSRIEFSSILFFLGILLTIGALESVAVTAHAGGEQVGLLKSFAQRMDQIIPNQNIVIIALGFLSAVIDNVPLVAASMGMYSQPLDHNLWHFIAYTAGTGGSILIIGSAAGVAAMGMEKIDFIWYLKNIAWLVITGYLAGCAVILLMGNGV